MVWNKMTRSSHQHIRKVGHEVYEVLDILVGRTRGGRQDVFFVTHTQYELNSYSEECIFDYVRLFGYESVKDLAEKHPDDPGMYIAEAIATVTSSFNRDSDTYFDDLDEAIDHINRRWLNVPVKKKFGGVGSIPVFQSTPGGRNSSQRSI